MALKCARTLPTRMDVTINNVHEHSIDGGDHNYIYI